MTWSFNYITNQAEWRMDIVSDLFVYSKIISKENWNKVKIAFIEGLEKQYKMLNEN